MAFLTESFGKELINSAQEILRETRIAQQPAHIRKMGWSASARNNAIRSRSRPISAFQSDLLDEYSHILSTG